MIFERTHLTETLFDSAFDAYLERAGFSPTADIDTCPDALYDAAHAYAADIVDTSVTRALELSNS